MLKLKREKSNFNMERQKTRIQANHTFNSGHCGGSAELMHDVCLVLLLVYCLGAQVGYAVSPVSLFLSCSTSCFRDWGFPLLSRDCLLLQPLAISHSAMMTKTMFCCWVFFFFQK